MLFFMEGCAHNRLPMDSRQDLSHRIEKLMLARISNQWAQVYTFLDPAFRNEVALADYLKIPGNTQTRSFEIKQIDIDPEGNRATAMLTCELLTMGFTLGNVPEVQHWTLLNQTWYLHVKSKGSLFPTD
jgi:hypothetical protein